MEQTFEELFESSQYNQNIKPGQIIETLTFFLFKSKYKLSAKLIKADFDAQYAPATGSPL